MSINRGYDRRTLLRLGTAALVAFTVGCSRKDESASNKVGERTTVIKTAEGTVIAPVGKDQVEITATKPESFRTASEIVEYKCKPELTLDESQHKKYRVPSAEDCLRKVKNRITQRGLKL